mmetsp:Transcript_22803/g.41057  ORF Transcript_22803/g.41057 Transcript_22803/m.41057 type:complete len:475 (-) Transcript_22803:2201-3625(-)
MQRAPYSQWMDNERISNLIGSIQEDFRLQRGPFDSPDPSKVEHLKQEWELRQHGASPNVTKLSTILANGDDWQVFNLTEMYDTVDYEENEPQLEHLLREYTGSMPKIINAEALMLRARGTSVGFFESHKATWGQGLSPFPSKMSSIDRDRDKMGMRLAHAVAGPNTRRDVDEGRIRGGTKIVHFPRISRQKSKVLDRPWRDEPRRSASCEPRIESRKSSFTPIPEFEVPDYHNTVKARTKHKNRKPPVLDYSFCDLRNIYQIRAREPRGGVMWVDVHVPKESNPELEPDHGFYGLPNSRSFVSEEVQQDEKMVIERRLVASGLKLDNNQLTTLEGITEVLTEKLKPNCYNCLQWVDLSCNGLLQVPEELLPLPLVVLYMHSNKITHMADVEKVRALRETLVTFSLNGNPVAETRAHKDYRPLIMMWLPKLRALDFSTITATDHEELEPVGRQIAKQKAEAKIRAEKRRQQGPRP